MDTITTKELKTFLSRQPAWPVSMFMPTHGAGRETQQGPIRFKNLLQEAEKRLLGKGVRSPDVRDMLEPARCLLQERSFWQNQSHGLADRATHFYEGARRSGGSIQSTDGYRTSHSRREGGRFSDASRASGCIVCGSWHTSMG